MPVRRRNLGADEISDESWRLSGLSPNGITPTYVTCVLATELPPLLSNTPVTSGTERYVTAMLATGLTYWLGTTDSSPGQALSLCSATSMNSVELRLEKLSRTSSERMSLVREP